MSGKVFTTFSGGRLWAWSGRGVSGGLRSAGVLILVFLFNAADAKGEYPLATPGKSGEIAPPAVAN